MIWCSKTCQDLVIKESSLSLNSTASCGTKKVHEFLRKGQLISKCLFGIFNCPKKQTKKLDFTAMVP